MSREKSANFYIYDLKESKMIATAIHGIKRTKSVYKGKSNTYGSEVEVLVNDTKDVLLKGSEWRD